MSAKKPIVVRIDGKQAKKKASKEISRNIDKIGKVNREQAATVEESSENKIQTFAREYDTPLSLSKSIPKNRNYFNMFKPIIIAIISAITIGSIMGFVMLKIIVNFDNDLNATPAYLVPGQNEENDNKEKGSAGESTSNGSLFQISAMSAFVLQGGVFSSVANAEAESAKFIEQGYSPVIWEKDSQYFLLISSGISKEDLQEDTDALMDHGIDAYAKEWTVGEKEIKLTEKEYNWFSSFQDNWNMALGKDNIEIETWKGLVGEAPKGSEAFNSFVANITEQINSVNDKNSGQVLLSMWELYDSFLTTEQMNLE
ncbi:SPOR domain-containing protein [Paucisalibacillus globulus]|uniref:SPOR domain-containing protein n=1 Tax=Paucisalibacillus globulus TaxID=351095 RepID=UPI000417AF7A|nr:SPOR domain-containing protein [Paucisalibacillus globulus]